MVTAPSFCTLEVVAATDLQQIAIERRAKVEEFQRKHRIGLLTLLFTDVVDSAKFKQALGDREGVTAIQRHHAAIREVLGQFSEGEEIETAGDSFFIVFTKPSDAVKFSLLVQARLRALAVEAGRPLFDRIGIHVGEVWIEEHQGTGKEKDLYGIQVDTCARVQSLAEADQILLTRSPFDAARQALRGEEVKNIGALSWLSHGPYMMKGIEEPLEICEVGELSKAKLNRPPDTEKARRFISLDSEPVLGWRPAVDQAVPGTSWVLEKKLGEGGFGEVWLGRDKRLKTEHVFKFCFRADRVRSLKREVTLFRLLKERVGEHPNIVGIEHVYFDEAPFYIVMQHVEGQDLATWCGTMGGVDKVPLAARIEIVAQIADALQAAHDSGVIHRDVKPSNILVRGHSDIHAYLTDFGIGQVVSEEVLSRLTRSGFTQTIVESSSRSGTQLYMAPELFSGKSASIRSDIYALGVVLYQLVVGDLSRAVSTDWAKQITDRLLREDLEKCFAGDPQERFAGAGQLAEQLRCLEERRVAFDKQQALLKDRERAAYRRGIMRTLALALVVIGLVSGLAIYAFLQRQKALTQRTAAEEQARIAETQRLAAQASEKKANNARDQADNLIRFMLFDLLDKLKPIGRLNVLDDVVEKAKEYFEKLPKDPVTTPHLQLQETMLNNLGDVLMQQGKLQEALESHQHGLEIAKRLADQDKTNVNWQWDLSWGYQKVGEDLSAQGKLQETLDAYRKSLNIRRLLADQDKTNTIWQWNLSVSYEKVANVLVAQGKLQEALDADEQSLNIRRTLADRDKSNSSLQRDLSISYQRVGDRLGAQGKFQEALDSHQHGLEIAKRLAEQDKRNANWQWDLSWGYQKVGDDLSAQGKLQETLDAYQQSLDIRLTLADQDKTNANWQWDLSVSYEMVGNVLVAQGKLQEALDADEQSLTIRRTLADHDKSNASLQRDLSISYQRVGDRLAAQGKFQEALESHQHGLEIAKRLAEQDRTNANWQWDLSWGYQRLGDDLTVQGKLQETLDAYQQSLNIRQTLADQDKTNAKWQWDLSVSYERVGTALVAQGKLEQALDVYQQDMEILKRLVDQDKSNALLKRDLSVSYNKIGDVFLAQSKLEQALDVYQQALTIVKRLAEQDKSNTVWQRDLIVSFYRVGTITAKIGGNTNAKPAEDLLRTGLNLAQLYSGPDRQKLIDLMNLALRDMVH